MLKITADQVTGEPRLRDVVNFVPQRVPFTDAPGLCRRVLKFVQTPVANDITGNRGLVLLELIILLSPQVSNRVYLVRRSPVEELGKTSGQGEGMPRIVSVVDGCGGEGSVQHRAAAVSVQLRSRSPLIEQRFVEARSNGRSPCLRGNSHQTVRQVRQLRAHCLRFPGSSCTPRCSRAPRSSTLCLREAGCGHQ